MKSLYYLIKKNYLIDKTNILMVILGGTIIPIFLQNSLKGVGRDFISFFISSFFVIYLIQNTVSGIENKYKGEAYLTITPYMRKNIVLSKYIFIYFNFVLFLVLYIITSFILPTKLYSLTIKSILSSLLIESLFFNVYIPIEILLGYDKVKYIFSILMISFPWVTTALLKYKVNFNFNFLLKLADYKLYAIVIVFITIITIISTSISLKIYSKKDL